MTAAEPPLVVGAGPAGLAAALILARHGVKPRLIDAAGAPSPFSRALLVNEHTLSLLENTGVSAALRARGHRVRGLRITVNGRQRATLAFGPPTERESTLLLLSQQTTEEVLTDAVRSAGIEIEHSTRLIGVTQEASSAIADVERPSGHDVIRARWVIGADGAHSAVRKSLGVDFQGAQYDFQWSLVDVHLDVADENFVDAILLGNAHFMLRFPLGSGLHRIITNMADIAGNIPPVWSPGTIAWSSEFTVSHRLVGQRIIGRCALIGDAAHIHSPAGGRGMNLGIEDAVTLADLIAVRLGAAKSLEDQLEMQRAWEQERLERARATVALSDRLQRFATTTSPLTLAIAPWLLRLCFALPPIRKQIFRLAADIR
jgi:2-polyprenyl-6-methoxyphenol hydroxylase-like FAD-dependent oxidoreductase